MGFIKAVVGASSQVGEIYKDVISYDNKSDVLVKMVTTSNGMITDGSRLFVQPGQCAIYTDQGAIKDIITEPGMYFMDTTAPTLFQVDVLKGITETFLTTMKRIAYEGDSILKQKVYFIDLTEKIGLRFGTSTPVIYNDPQWGPIEVKLHGEFTLQVYNPVNLLTNVVGTNDTYELDDIRNQVSSFILSEISVNIGTLGVSFTEIAAKQNLIADKIVTGLNNKFESFGVNVVKVVISGVDVAEEIKDAMRERTSIKMKATSVNNEQADIYTKLNTAEAIKDMANNQGNGNGATILGMNMGNTMAGVVNNSMNNATNNNNNNNQG